MNSKNNLIDNYKNSVFSSYIKNLIKNYSVKHNDRILLKYIETDRLDINTLLDSLDNEKFLKGNELSINIADYITEYIFNSDDYIKFKNNKFFMLDKILNNVKTYDQEGNIVDIELNLEQKELVVKQYQESFDEDIRNYIENNSEEFEELFIANNKVQFENLFPKSYIETLKEQAITNFCNNKKMDAVRYCLAFPEEMKSALSNQYVNNDKFKTLLVFNNVNNILELKKENIKVPTKVKEKEIDKPKEEIKKEVQKESKKESNKMSIFVTLSGNETKTANGIYVPINETNQIFIPKQLYKIDKDKIEILSNKSNQALMSEYLINNEEHTKTWISRLSLDEFYHKYYSIYEVQKEREVLV